MSSPLTDAERTYISTEAAENGISAEILAANVVRTAEGRLQFLTQNGPTTVSAGAQLLKQAGLAPATPANPLAGYPGAQKSTVVDASGVRTNFHGVPITWDIGTGTAAPAVAPAWIAPGALQPGQPLPTAKPTYEQLMANPALLGDWQKLDPAHVAAVQQSAIDKMRADAQRRR